MKLGAKLLIAACLVAAWFFCAFTLLLAESNSGYLKPSLDPAYVPTAEALFAHPLPTLESIHINPAPGSRIKSGTTLCVDVSTRAGDLFWTQVLINTQRIDRSDIEIVIYDNLNAYAVENYCFAPELEPGLHLIEVRPRNSPFDTRFSYTWAVRVAP